MEIMEIKNSAVVAHISQNELSEMGFPTNELSEEDIRLLIKRALKKAGGRIPRIFSADAFLNNSGLLLFASARRDGAPSKRFSSLSELSDFVKEKNSHPGDALFFLNDELFLVGAAVEDEDGLSPLPDGAETIIPSDAILRICEYFDF